MNSLQSFASARHQLLYNIMIFKDNIIGTAILFFHPPLHSLQRVLTLVHPLLTPRRASGYQSLSINLSSWVAVGINAFF